MFLSVYSLADIDECADKTDNCDNNGVCVNTNGSYYCDDCKPGFTGEGTSCRGKIATFGSFIYKKTFSSDEWMLINKVLFLYDGKTKISYTGLIMMLPSCTYHNATTSPCSQCGTSLMFCIN